MAEEGGESDGVSDGRCAHHSVVRAVAFENEEEDEEDAEERGERRCCDVVEAF